MVINEQLDHNITMVRAVVSCIGYRGFLPQFPFKSMEKTADLKPDKSHYWESIHRNDATVYQHAGSVPLPSIGTELQTQAEGLVPPAYEDHGLAVSGPRGLSDGTHS